MPGPGAYRPARVDLDGLFGVAELRLLAWGVCAFPFVEPGLLRRARRTLLPAAPVGLERRLWHHPAVQAHNVGGFSLASDIRLALVEDLMAPGNAKPLAMVRDFLRPILNEKNGHYAPLMWIEYELLFAAGSREAPRVDRLLARLEATTRPAAPDREHSGRQVARWLAFAWSGLPREIREHPAAARLSVYSSRLLGRPVGAVARPDEDAVEGGGSWAGVVPREDPASGADPAGGGSLGGEGGRVEIGLRVERDGEGGRMLIFGAAKPPHGHLSLPPAGPGVVELSWVKGGTPYRRRMRVTPGVPAEVSLPPASDIRVLTPDGTGVVIDPTEAPVCIQVAHGDRVGAGLLVGRRHVVIPDLLVAGAGPAWFDVRVPGGRWTPAFERGRRRGFVVLERVGAVDGDGPDVTRADRPDRLDGARWSALGFPRPPDGGPSEPRAIDGEVRRGFLALRGPLPDGYLGAPVTVDGRFVGLITRAGPGVPPDTDTYVTVENIDEVARAAVRRAQDAEPPVVVALCWAPDVRTRARRLEEVVGDRAGSTLATVPWSVTPAVLATERGRGALAAMADAADATVVLLSREAAASAGLRAAVGRLAADRPENPDDPDRARRAVLAVRLPGTSPSQFGLPRDVAEVTLNPRDRATWSVSEDALGDLVDSRLRQVPKARVGLWGAASSGKSTFLAVLSTAAPIARTGRSWTAGGNGKASREYLAGIRYGLTYDGRFPTPTQQATTLRCALVERERGTAPGARLLLEVVDRPGEDFAPRRDGRTADEIAAELAGCSGLVYLFDPVNEDEARHRREPGAFAGNAAYFCDVAETLWEQAEEGGRLVDGRLPQQLAVCVGKFDNPVVYDVARKLKILSWPDGPHRPPRMDADTARYLFAELCRGRVAGSDLDRLPVLIDTLFRPERVRYFVSSSVGFYLHPGGFFDENDYENVEFGDDRKAWLRGDIRPLNVLEPVLFAAGELDE
jgi:hypothetical protein